MRTLAKTRFLLALLTAISFLLSPAPSRAAVVHATYSFTDFTTHALNVKRVTVTPLASGADYDGAQLSNKPLIYSVPTYYMLTNGSITISNLVCGYAYKVAFSDGFSEPSITNYFGTNITSGTVVNGNDYKTTYIQWANGVAVQIWYAYLSNTNSSTSGALTNNETRAVTFKDQLTIGTSGGFQGDLNLHDGASSTANINFSSGFVTINAPVIATEFVGSGANLTGIPTTSGLAAGSYAMPNFAPKFFNVETNFSPAQFSATYRYFNTLNTTQANLYVNSTTGNNATAQRNNPNLPWRDIWDLIDSTYGAVITTGAVAVAKSGDTVVLQSGVYFAPKIPLPNGVHLFAPNGATIIRTNFARDVNVLSPGSGGAYGSDLGIGALIKPGNNSVVDGVVVIATNGSFDACIGYYDRAQTTDGADWSYGFTESISTNSLFRNCFFYGGSDVHYLDGTNTSTGTIYFDNCVFRSQWDAMRSYSNSITYTKNCDIFTTNTYSTSPALGASRAVVMQANSKWYDYGSRVGAGGGTNENNATFFMDNSAAILSGTVLYISGTNAAYDIVRSNAPSGWYLEGATFRQ